ncbi:hypothetical protein PMAYCL1PPCAC_17865, partial [Pristionchus mayeri]
KQENVMTADQLSIYLCTPRPLRYSYRSGLLFVRFLKKLLLPHFPHQSFVLFFLLFIHFFFTVLLLFLHHNGFLESSNPRDSIHLFCYSLAFDLCLTGSRLQGSSNSHSLGPFRSQYHLSGTLRLRWRGRIRLDNFQQSAFFID